MITPLSSIRLIRQALAAFCILAGTGLLCANILTPPAPIARFAADEQTSAIYELTQEAISSGIVADTTGQSGKGKLTGNWELISPQEIQPAYHSAARAISTGDKNNRTCVSVPDLAIRGAFTVDILWRSASAGGMGMQIGEAANSQTAPLQMNFLHRGPGSMQLRIPVKTADGKIQNENMTAYDIYHSADIGPVRFDDFYTTSLTFDGNKVFALYVNNRKVFEKSISTGEVVLPGKGLTAGEVGSTSSQFRGSAIAAIRISRDARTYTPAEPKPASFTKTGNPSWIFDAGPANAPIQAGAIRLGASDMYTATQGYGWLKTPLGEFNSWYSPGRFDYAPDQAFAKNTYKIHSALMRGGVTVPDGELFRADIPDGEYWVSVGLGDSNNSSAIQRISVNDVELGSDLRMKGNIYRGNIPHRIVRNKIRIEQNKGLILTGQSTGGGGLPIQNIVVLPYVPAPVIWQGSALAWQGDGKAPEALATITKLLAEDRLADAARAADSITDPLIKASTLACILGKPHLPDQDDIAIAWQIRQLLISILRDNPKNASAQWLFDSTEKVRHATIGYTDDRGDEVVYGVKLQLLLQVANQGMAIRPEDPEYWQARFIAAAAIWQTGVQMSAFGPTSDSYLPKSGPEAFAAPGAIFRQIKEIWPAFRIARIMLGEKLPVTTTWQAPANAPQWAALQYELMTRIVDTIHYWVEKRMDANGLLGGGLGDDVEALRWWSIGITLADDQTTKEGFLRLSDAAWRSTRGKGYALTLQDVEHSSEDISDSQPMRALIGFGTPEFSKTIDRLTIMKSVFRDTWTGLDPQGQRMFKGHFLSATAVDREGDVPYNLRAIRPLLWGAWANQGKDKELDELLIAYARSWRDAIMNEYDGKPRGIVPMMIRWGHQKARLEQSDGHLMAPTSWVFPGYWSFEYPGGYSEHVYDLLLAAYELSGDRTFLEPVEYALDALAKIQNNDMDADKYPKGSADWALRAGANMIGMAGANYRVLTGNMAYDDVLLRIAPPHSRFMILASRAAQSENSAVALAPLIDKLKVDLAEMNSNPELRTTMVQSTDRIYVCGSLIIDAMATGVTTSPRDLRGGEILWPTYQITWAGTQGQLAALVEKASPTSLVVRLYSFSDSTLKLQPRIWRLQPGTYQLALKHTDIPAEEKQRIIAENTVEITSRGQQIDLSLPPRTPAILTIIRK